MKTVKVNLILCILFLISFYVPTYSGIVILTEVPEAVKQWLVKAQAAVQNRLEQINGQSKEQYVFERGSHSPHMTLAYVSDKELAMDQLQQAEPKLIESLYQLSHSNPVEMGEGMRDAHLVVWPGKKEKILEGNKYKNYAILAVEMKPSTQLLNLVKNINKTLENHPIASKSEFPFSSHVTIGWLYDKKDIDPTQVVEAVKLVLEKFIVEFKTDQSFTIDSFKLSTHDKKQIIFPFRK